jgi:hypothetical protein
MSSSSNTLMFHTLNPAPSSRFWYDSAPSLPCLYIWYISAQVHACGISEANGVSGQSTKISVPNIGSCCINSTFFKTDCQVWLSAKLQSLSKVTEVTEGRLGVRSYQNPDDGGTHLLNTDISEPPKQPSAWEDFNYFCHHKSLKTKT